MRCPVCDEIWTRVIWARSRYDHSGDPHVKRRRECTACGQRFNSYENYELADLEAAFRVAEALKILDKFRTVLTK